MKIKIAIVDDNEILRKEIEDIIRESLQENIFLKAYSKASNLLDEIDERFDIYFLDIEMPGMNGLELSQKIRQKDKRGEIVFLTSYAKYALQGYHARAYAYLLKEEMRKSLPNVLEELKKLVQLKNQKCYVIESSTQMIRLPYHEIQYIFKDGKNSVFVTDRGEERQRISLETLYQELNSSEFIYVDKGKIANIQHVKKVVKDTLIMTNGEELVISRSNIKKVKLAIRTYWKNMK